MLKPADEVDLFNWVYEAKSELSFLAGLFFSSDTQKKKNHVDSDRIGPAHRRPTEIQEDVSVSQSIHASTLTQPQASCSIMWTYERMYESVPSMF